jgi:hypothetical protein
MGDVIEQEFAGAEVGHRREVSRYQYVLARRGVLRAGRRTSLAALTQAGSARPGRVKF